MRIREGLLVLLLALLPPLLLGAALRQRVDFALLPLATPLPQEGRREDARVPYLLLAPLLRLMPPLLLWGRRRRPHPWEPPRLGPLPAFRVLVRLLPLLTPLLPLLPLTGRLEEGNHLYS